MPNSIISEGKTTNEAIENGLKKLRVSKNEVDVKVLESEDKRSFFSILAPRVVKVELTVKENNQKEDEHTEVIEKKEYKEVPAENLEIAQKNAESFLKDFSKSLGIEIKYSINHNPYGLDIKIDGEDMGFLIGYRGETLYALQSLLSIISSKGLENRIRVILDIEGYKSKREKTLEDLADKIAKTVIRTKRDVTLEPMKAYERKIIHSKLQGNTKVTTKSVGEEPRRRVVISLIK